MPKFLNPRPGSQPAKPVATKSIGGTHEEKPAPSAVQSQPVAPTTVTEEPTDFFSAMRTMVEGFSVIDENVFRKNMELSAGKGMTYADRTISFECAEFLMTNLAYIFMGLVVDPRFKKAFVDAVSVELTIDTAPEADKLALRKSMKNAAPYESVGSIILGLTEFTKPIKDELTAKMRETFDSLDKYSDEFDEAVAGLNYETKLELGMIFSNYMYLIRAFTHNDVFMSYVITIVEEVKAKLAA